MDNLWTWFKRANAKTVLAVAVAVLLAVAGWWTWKAFTPVSFSAVAVHPVPPPKSATALGLLAYIKGESQVKTHPSAASLFALPSFLRPKPPEPQPKPEPPAPKPEPPEPQPKTEPPAPTPPKHTPPAPLPPQKNVVTLTYRGTYSPSDGGPALALIEDSQSLRSTFYPAGTNVFGIVIEKIEMEQLSIAGRDATTTTLIRGISAPFADGKRVD